VAAVAAAMATGGLGCKKPAPVAPPPPAVVVMEVATTNVPVTTEIIGQLDSPQNVEVRARVEGFVDKVLFAEGTEIKEGAPLFLLDKKPFEEKLAAANGLLGEAKAALNKYEKDVARLKPLAEKRAIPQQDLDNAQASVEVGKAQVVSAQAQVQSALIDLGYCEMNAPISGLIGAKKVSVGELVGKGEPTLLTTISTLDPIWFYCSVSEVNFLRAETEMRKTGRRVSDAAAELYLADGRKHPEMGKFVFIDRAVDVKTGTLRVRAEFPNPDKVLRPGMFARIKVEVGIRKDAILVPDRAVSELQGRNFAWVIGADNKASLRTVTVGETIGSNLLVLEGIKAGERIVVEGLQKVREGSVVQPMTAEQMAEATTRAALASERHHEKPAAKE
jgi:membrane fusion protein (multidrug efflux system)